jgi:hypothetical protein
LRTLPPKMVQVLASFAPLFSKRLWQHAQVLLVGAILAPARRTVGSALRAIGLDRYERFHRYHRVLSRARWSSRKASRVLLGLLALRPSCPRGGSPSRGHRRDAGATLREEDLRQGPLLRSGTLHPRDLRQEQWALRWVCAIVLVESPWASRVWALPFLSALAPSERYAAERGRRHKKITEWAWQLLLALRRWHPKREIVAVADGAYASLKLLDRCRKP